MPTDKLKFTKAKVGVNSPQLASVQDIIGTWRAALAPMLNANIDDLPRLQSEMITAAAIFAGMVTGHMIVVGALSEKDKRRVGAMMQTNFRNGIQLGREEAQIAMLQQTPPAGSA